MLSRSNLSKTVVKTIFEVLFIQSLFVPKQQFLKILLQPMSTWVVKVEAKLNNFKLVCYMFFGRLLN